MYTKQEILNWFGNLFQIAGSNHQMLIKNSDDVGDFNWADQPQGIPNTFGQQDKFLKVTYDSGSNTYFAEWIDFPALDIKGEYANNTAALDDGLNPGDIYRLPISDDNNLLAVVRPSAYKIEIITTDAGATAPYTDAASFKAYQQGEGNNPNLEVISYVQEGNTTTIYVRGMDLDSGGHDGVYPYLNFNVTSYEYDIPSDYETYAALFLATASSDSPGAIILETIILGTTTRLIDTLGGHYGSLFTLSSFQIPLVTEPLPTNYFGSDAPTAGWGSLTVTINSALASDTEILRIQGLGATIVTV